VLGKFSVLGRAEMWEGVVSPYMIRGKYLDNAYKSHNQEKGSLLNISYFYIKRFL
jgi:hypothetical protein